MIEKLNALNIHDSIITETKVDIFNQTADLRLHLYGGAVTTIHFKGVVCFHFTGMNLWTKNDRDTILECYEINDNPIIAHIKELLDSQLKQDSSLTQTGQGYPNKRYDISDCFSVEFLLDSGDKMMIIFETLEITMNGSISALPH